MQTFAKLILPILACGIALGCASTKKRPQEDDSLWASEDTIITIPYEERQAERRFRRSFERIMADDMEGRGDFTHAKVDRKGMAPLRLQGSDIHNRLLRRAHAAIGTPYVPGGEEPGGFDCSGLVCWAYKSVGVTLPRTAREQSVVGRRITNVADMRAGDIVAFHHPRRGYHTGIYVGGGKFIHSPRRRTRVRINSLNDPYFQSTFLGARRVNLQGSENLVAQAEGRLRDFAEEKAVRELSRKHGWDRKSARRDRDGKRDRLDRREGRDRRDDRYARLDRRDRDGKRDRLDRREGRDRRDGRYARLDRRDRDRKRDRDNVREERSRSRSRAVEIASRDRHASRRAAQSERQDRLEKGKRRMAEERRRETASTASRDSVKKSSRGQAARSEKKKQDFVANGNGKNKAASTGSSKKRKTNS